MRHGTMRLSHTLTAPANLDAALHARRDLSRRHLYFLLLVLASVVAFWAPLKSLWAFSQRFDYGSHIVLIIPVSACLIYLIGPQVFSRPRFDFAAGSVGLLAGIALALAAYFYPPLHDDSLSLEILALVELWLSGFILCYGMGAFRCARFSLLFLLLLVPIPGFVVERIIYFLQAGSADVAFWLLNLLQVPVFKEGFILRLPGLDLEVAKQCSGIRSSLALLITTLLVAEFILHSFWRKSLLVLSIVPILIFKNGVRIVTLALLSIYVNRGFMHGWLHTSGGIVFYLLGLLALVPLAMVLRAWESRSAGTPVAAPAVSAE